MRPTYFYLRAVEGRLTRDPTTKVPLSAKGERKPKTSFYIRRVRSGDAEEIEDPNMTAELLTIEEPRTDG